MDIFLVDAGDGGTYEVKVEDGKLYYNRKWFVLCMSMYFYVVHVKTNTICFHMHTHTSIYMYIICGRMYIRTSLIRTYVHWCVRTQTHHIGVGSTRVSMSYWNPLNTDRTVVLLLLFPPMRYVCIMSVHIRCVRLCTPVLM